MCTMHITCMVHIVGSVCKEMSVSEASSTVRPNAVLAVLASAGIVAALMQTLVVPLLGPVVRVIKGRLGT